MIIEKILLVSIKTLNFRSTYNIVNNDKSIWIPRNVTYTIQFTFQDYPLKVPFINWLSSVTSYVMYITMAPAILKLSIQAGAVGIIDFYKYSRDHFLFSEKIIKSFFQANF